MARTTRSKASSSSGTKSDSKSTTPSNTNSKYTLSAESSNPPKLFILPTKATKDARIVSLLNPRYAKPTRYLVCPETGIYEFTRIAAPKSNPRSWLIECGNTGNIEQKSSEDSAELSAYVTKGADLYVATPVDPIFLLLPAFADQSGTVKDGKRMFVSSDDHLDSIRDASPHLAEILRWGKVRTLLESRMVAMCDTAEAGDETMFRFSEDKLLAEILGKAQKMCHQPLPKSMEDKFVTKALEAPVVGVRREDTTLSSVTQETQTQAPAQPETSMPTSEASTPKVESESQSSVSSTETAESLTSEASTAATSVVTTEESTTTITTTTELLPTLHASPEVIKLQRLRTAFNFICSCYIAPAQAAQLSARLTSQTPALVDFTPLDSYIEEITKLRQEAAATRSMGDYSRKRALDDEELADRAEKKRKKDEEEKRKKAGESRGVRDLKKVNTVGMRKMSDFFKKK